MSFLFNILWIIFGGLIMSISWLIAGILLCITVIGIPFGIQCFKISKLMLAPFGKEVIYGNSMGSFFMNIIWILIFGWGLALEALIVGVLWCITIIGIPIGIQSFKFAKLAFMPFGSEVK